MADQYCTAADVRNHTVDPKVTEVSWTNTDVDIRIVEAQNVINSKLGGYFTVPFAKGAASVPPIINTICKFYSRYLVLRDIMEEQVVETDDSYRVLANKWKKNADEYLDGILAVKKGSIPMVIIDVNGDEVERKTGGRLIDSSTSGIGTVNTMNDELDQKVDPEHSEDPVVVEED